MIEQLKEQTITEIVKTVPLCWRSIEGQRQWSQI
jgi:hypothetical protein